MDEDMEEDDALIEGIYEEGTIPFAKLDDDIRYPLEELLADNINEFMIHTDYIPEGKELEDINEWVLKETCDHFSIKVIPDATYDSLVAVSYTHLLRFGILCGLLSGQYFNRKHHCTRRD